MIRPAPGRGAAVEHEGSEASMVAIDALPLHHLHWVQQPLWLSEKIGITGPIPRETGFEDTGGPLYLDPEGMQG
jgi:7,8-dihydropterin-6-yl-methyl-4-(beta-D-ribofuranosyl)aminobenzene 5'-phosphate synthase